MKTPADTKLKPNDIQQRQIRIFVVLLLLIGFFLFVYKVGDRDLWAPDEDEYAQISREMIRSGNWAMPTVNGEPWAIKPVLYNWLVSAISLPWGDVDEFRARIFSSLAALGTAFLTFYLGRMMFSPMAGFLAALILGTNIVFLHQARWAQTYMLSTFFAALAVVLFFRGYQQADKRTRSYLLMYLSVGLGVLTMGPVNLAVPGLVVFAYLIVARDLKHIKQLRLGWGILIFLAVTLPWYLWVSLNSEYGYELLISTNTSRYFTALHHPQPFYYYLKDLPWAFAPWSLFLPSAFLLAFSHRSAEDRRALKFLLVWSISVFLFFTLSRGKRPQYILSLYPALALLVGYLGDRALALWHDPYYRRAVVIPSLIFLPILVILTVGLPVGTHIYFKPLFGIALGVSTLTAISTVLLLVAWRKQNAGMLLFLPAGFVLVLIVFSTHVVIPKMNEYKSPKPFCDEIVARMEKGADWAMYKFYRAAYVYYTDSFVKKLENEAQLRHFLDRDTQALVAMPEREFDQLKEPLADRIHVITRRKIGHRPMILISNQDR